MKHIIKRFLLFFILLALPLCACLPSPSAANTGSEYGEITAELVALVDKDAELKKLFEKAVDQAAVEVTERDMNPVYSLTSLYKVLDRSESDAMGYLSVRQVYVPL